MAAATFPLFRSKKLQITETQTIDETESSSLLNVFSNPSYFKDPENQLVKLVQSLQNNETMEPDVSYQLSLNEIVVQNKNCLILTCRDVS
jgi:hypothetical protein